VGVSNFVCVVEISTTRWPRQELGCCATGKAIFHGTN